MHTLEEAFFAATGRTLADDTEDEPEPGPGSGHDSGLDDERGLFA